MDRPLGWHHGPSASLGFPPCPKPSRQWATPWLCGDSPATLGLSHTPCPTASHAAGSPCSILHHGGATSHPTSPLMLPCTPWHPTPRGHPTPTRGAAGHLSLASRVRGSPLGPFIRLTSMMVSGGGCRRRTTSRTTGPASFRASTALLCTTSDTSTSFTRSTQSFTLQAQGGPELSGEPPACATLLWTPLLLSSSRTDPCARESCSSWPDPALLA